jgi:hypothetical protein
MSRSRRLSARRCSGGRCKPQLTQRRLQRCRRHTLNTMKRIVMLNEVKHLIEIAL